MNKNEWENEEVTWDVTQPSRSESGTQTQCDLKKVLYIPQISNSVNIWNNEYRSEAHSRHVGLICQQDIKLGLIIPLVSIINIILMASFVLFLRGKQRKWYSKYQYIAPILPFLSICLWYEIHGNYTWSVTIYGVLKSGAKPVQDGCKQGQGPSSLHRNVEFAGRASHCSLRPHDEQLQCQLLVLINTSWVEGVEESQ